MKNLIATAVALSLLGAPAAIGAPSRTTHTTTTTSTTTMSNDDAMDMAHLKHWMPSAYKTWQHEVPGFLFIPYLRWLTHLEGTTSEVRPIILDGQKVFVGGVCQPHGCENNDVELVVSAKKVAGLAHFRDLDGNVSLLTVGELSSTELSCLNRLYSNAKGDC